MNTILTDTKYAKLVADIRRLIEDGKQKTLNVANQELVKTYWQVGKRITQEELAKNAGYGM